VVIYILNKAIFSVVYTNILRERFLGIASLRLTSHNFNSCALIEHHAMKAYWGSPDRLWGPHNLLSNGYRDLLSRG